jgi:hypothetical protein
MKEHNDYILELPGFVPESFCKHLITTFENTPNPTPGTVMRGGKHLVIPNTKKTLEHCICCISNFEKEYLTCKNFIKNAISLYLYTLKQEYDYNQELHVFETVFNWELSDKMYPTIQKISNGTKNKWHFDGGINTKAFVVAILYLNTLNSEEGGCTEFGHGRKIKPECGKIVIFPQIWTYPHRGCEVVSNDKYIVSCLVEVT